MDLETAFYFEGLLRLTSTTLAPKSFMAAATTGSSFSISFTSTLAVDIDLGDRMVGLSPAAGLVVCGAKGTMVSFNPSNS